MRLDGKAEPLGRGLPIGVPGSVRSPRPPWIMGENALCSAKTRVLAARPPARRRLPAAEPRGSVSSGPSPSPAAVLAGSARLGRGLGPPQEQTLLRLQATYGNQAVQRLISSGGAAPVL